jgi:hypothetical protein
MTLPRSGEACLCCRNHGKLPPAELNGKPVGMVGMPGMVDGDTIKRCCDQCVAALFFGATHPHEVNL